jgi:hypothetical protein
MTKNRLSFWLMPASFAGLVIVMLTTNPIDKIIWAIVFFGLALVFLLSFGFWLVRLQLGEVSNKNKYRIVALSLIVLSLLMFRSAQSLNWVDAVILLLIAFGLGFYISRRA